MGYLKDKMSGYFDKAVGRLKQGLSKDTGDQRLHSKGVRQESVGSVKDTVGTLKKKIGDVRKAG